MRVLLTGATGKLGAYLLRQLLGAGADVIAWSGARAGELFGVPVRPVDLADADAVAGAFRDARPAAVLHTAALSALGDCHRDPARAWDVNVSGTAVLTQAAAQAHARLVYVS